MMDVEVVTGDVASVDPDLLQLPELSPLALKSNPYLAEELFSIWLSFPDTNKLVFLLFNSFLYVFINWVLFNYWFFFLLLA